MITKKARTARLTPMLLENLECFTLEEIMKIITMEPNGNIHNTPAVPARKRGVLAGSLRPNTGATRKGGGIVQ